MKKVYEVSGMTCGGCVSSVKKAISLALPQAQVEVSLESKTATITGEHEESVAKAAIEDAGFDVVGTAH